MTRGTINGLVLTGAGLWCSFVELPYISAIFFSSALICMSIGEVVEAIMKGK